MSVINYSPPWANCCHCSRNVLSTQFGVLGGVEWAGFGLKGLPDCDPLGKSVRVYTGLGLELFLGDGKRGNGQCGN